MLAGQGISKCAFVCLAILFFVLYVPTAFLTMAQVENVQEQGQINSRDYYWYNYAYYAMGCIASLGAIFIGQFKRCEKEMVTQLPIATRNEILQPVVSLFMAGLFFTWAIKTDQGFNGHANKWNYSPICMFFVCLSSSTHKFLQIKQDPRQMFAIVLITAALFTVLGVYDQGWQADFDWWAFTCMMIATISYAHFFTKEEYLLKRRQITVLNLLDLQGQRVFGLYLIAIFITSIIQWCSGDNWTAGIYTKAVFSSWMNIFLTAMTPIASGIMQAIMLTLIFNSSSIRYCTILILPSSIVAACYAGSEQTWVAVASIFLAVGTILYNLNANCGQEAIDEYRTEVRMRMDEQEAVFFKADATVMQQQVVYQDPNVMYVQQPMMQQPMMQQPMMQQNYAVNQIV